MAYRVVDKAIKENFDVVFIDTAGRLHNKVNLMNELESVKKSIVKLLPEGPSEVILVVDGTSGQNALSQAREFNNSIDLSGVVITKLDGTPKGGIVISIADELGLPIRFVGLGEGKDDLVRFDSQIFAETLVGNS